jgi:hypothetical protein
MPIVRTMRESMPMKALIVLMLTAVLGALAGAGFFMLRRPDGTKSRDPKAMARALALRVTLSVALFLIVLLAWWAGWIKPSGIPLSSN